MKIKHLFMGMLAVAGILFASCQKEAMTNVADGEYVSASFRIDVPAAIATKAIGDGTTVDYVQCAVYDANGTELNDLRGDLKLANLEATYQVNLVKGQTYRIAFFAYNKASLAYDLTDLTSIKVMGKQNSNMENRDAFTAYKDVTVGDTPLKETVTLYRPFAQLNIGSYLEDIGAAASAGIVVTKTSVKVSNVYTEFNAYANAVAGETTSMEFGVNTIPDEALMVDVNCDKTAEEYEYLALNYILVGDLGSTKSLTDVEFAWATATDQSHTYKFENIPVQRNYRTNILGHLLTGSNGGGDEFNTEIKIVVDPDFDDPNYTEDRDDYLVNGPVEPVEPLSVEWATANVGATDENPIGNYYQWGSLVTNPVSVAENEVGVQTYNWNVYPFSSTTDFKGASVTASDMTKYNADDNLTILELDNDVANVTLGDGWRIPTLAEMEELIEKCTWTWNEEKKGFDVVEKTANGQSIFLPAGGYIRNRSTDSTNGVFCCYWTSTLASEKLNAHYLESEDGNITTTTYYRHLGMPIRPVRAK